VQHPSQAEQLGQRMREQVRLPAVWQAQPVRVQPVPALRRARPAVAALVQRAAEFVRAN